MSNSQPLSPSFMRLWFALAVSAAVDVTKFRTCEQTGFCRRFRAFVREPKDGSLHAVQSVDLQGHLVTAKLKELTLELRFFRAHGSCGVVQLVVVPPDGLHGLGHRAVVRDRGLEPDFVELQAHPGESHVTSGGGCGAVLRHRPLRLQLLREGRLLQSFNARQLLNHERPRRRGEAPRRPPEDAADLDTDGLWEETFGSFEDSKPQGPQGRGFDVSFHEISALVGLAEHATALHLGKFEEPYRLYNLDVFEYEVDVPMALYGAVPLVTAVAAVSSGLLAVNPTEGFVQVAVGPKSTETWWSFEAGDLEVYALLGPTVEEVLRQYHAVTGLPRMAPMAALGKHQSRWNYVTPRDVMEVSAGFDKHGIPVDFLWLDLEHTDGKRYFTWDPRHFPEPQVHDMLDNLNKTHRKLVTIIDPHLFAEDPNYTVAQVFRQKRLLIQQPTGGDYQGFCWPGNSVYPDFCSEEAREEWAKLFHFEAYPGRPAELYTWNDMNEPSVFDGPEITLPKDTLHRCDSGNATVEHRQVHNLYGFWVQEASTLGQLRRAPNVRPFVLTRSFFAGSHRHGAAWTGDNMASWKHLARSVPMLLSLALCGISLAGADVAGFMGDPDSELLVRWHQLGIWYPFYRAHAHLTSKRREPWLFGTAVMEKLRSSVLTRYKLLPMWYTLAAEWALLGSPMIRPIWYHDLEDQEAFAFADSHFFVGDGILVRAPEASKSVRLHLPPGVWFDFWQPTASPRWGGTYQEPLAKQHVPVFVRAGHCFAQRWRQRRSTGAMLRDPHSLVCYGQRASGRVYLDDGRSLNYQEGDFIYDAIRWDGRTLSGAPNASLGMSRALVGAATQVERVVLVGVLAPTRVLRGGTPLVFQVEPVANSTWSVVTVRRPQVDLGTSWSLVLE